jgi:hypothetical protein
MSFRRVLGRVMSLRRVMTLGLVVALVLVPAIGRAVQRLDPPNAKPRLAGSYRSVDVRPDLVLIAPDTSARCMVPRVVVDPGWRGDRGCEATLLAPVVSDREALRGPPPSHHRHPSPLVNR